MRNMLHLHDREKPMIAELSSAPITGTLTSRARMNQTQRKLKAKFLYHCTFTKSKLNGIYIGDRGGNYFSLRGKHSSACWFPLLRWKSVSVWWHYFLRRAETIYRNKQGFEWYGEVLTWRASTSRERLTRSKTQLFSPWAHLGVFSVQGGWFRLNTTCFGVILQINHRLMK